MGALAQGGLSTTHIAALRSLVQQREGGCCERAGAHLATSTMKQQTALLLAKALFQVTP